MSSEPTVTNIESTLPLTTIALSSSELNTVSTITNEILNNVTLSVADDSNATVAMNRSTFESTNANATVSDSINVTTVSLSSTVTNDVHVNESETAAETSVTTMLSSPIDTSSVTTIYNNTTETSVSYMFSEQNSSTLHNCTRYLVTNLATKPITSSKSANDIIKPTISETTKTTIIKNEIKSYSNLTTNVAEFTQNTETLSDLNKKTSFKATDSQPSLVTCEAYPKDCNRPNTWETTLKGETRDFYQILKARYGDRIKILRHTTHWPRRSAFIMEDNTESFVFGEHVETK